MALFNKQQLFLVLLNLMYFSLTVGLPQPTRADVSQSNECGYFDFLGENEMTLTADQQCYDFVIDSTVEGYIGGGCTCSFYAEYHCNGTPLSLGIGPFSGPFPSGSLPLGSYLCTHNANTSTYLANGTILLTKDIQILSDLNTASTHNTDNTGSTAIATDNGVILCKDVNYSGGCFWFAATATCTDLESKLNNLGNTISSLMAFGCDGFFYEYADCSVRGPTTYFLADATGGVITLPAFSSYWNDRMQSFMCF